LKRKIKKTHKSEKDKKKEYHRKRDKSSHKDKRSSFRESSSYKDSLRSFNAVRSEEKDRKKEDINESKLRHRSKEWRKSLPAPSSKNTIDKAAVTATASTETPKASLSHRKITQHSKEI